MSTTLSQRPTPKIDSIEDLEKLLAEKDEAILALGNLVRGMDERIRLLTALVDHHHKLFTDHGWAPQRPAGGGSLAN